MTRSSKGLSAGLLLVCSLAAAPPAAAQGLRPDLLARHLQGLRIERERQLAERWLAADAEARAAAQRLLTSRRKPPGRALEALALSDLSDAARALSGEARGEDGPSWQARVVDALDLRVVPGAFSARERGRGEPLTVQVRTLYEVRAEEDVELGLLWVAGDGQEQRARREPVTPWAFDGPGFPMYVRPPVSRPGRWWLVAELTHGERSWRGFPVPVDCVEALTERRESLAQSVIHREGALVAQLSGRLDALLEHGVRGADATPLEAWLRWALDEGPTNPPAGVAPFTLEAFDGGRSVLWSPAGDEGQSFERVLLLASAAPEHPTDLLAGEAGRRWAELARELDARLIATDLPAIGTRGQSLPDLCAYLAGEQGTGELTVVARRDSAVLLPPKLRGGAAAEAVDALVLDGGPATLTPPRLGLRVPLLSVQVLADEQGEERGGTESAPWTWLRLPAASFLAELELPARVGAWLTELRASREGREPR